MQGSTPEQRRLFYNWRYSVVDWKWGYMESSFDRIAAALETFFLFFDVVKFRTPTGHSPTNHEVVDIPSMTQPLVDAQKKASIKLAEMESHKVFSKAVGIASP